MMKQLEDITLELGTPPAATQHPARVHRAILLVRTLPCTKELWPVARVLRETRRYECIAVIGREILAWKVIAPKVIEHYASLGLRVIDYEGRSLVAMSGTQQATADVSQTPSSHQPSGLLQRVKRFVGQLSRSPFGRAFGSEGVRQFFDHYRKYTHEQRLAEHLIAAERPDLFILMESENLYTEAVITYVATRRRIPTVMLPFGDNGQSPEVRMQTYLANGIAKDVTTKKFWNWVVAALMPNWVQTYGGHQMLRYPAAQAAAAWCAGLRRTDPWFPHRWVAKRAVLCERAKGDIETRQGFRPDQLVITGQAAMDQIYAIWRSPQPSRSELMRTLGLVEGKRTVLFIVPGLALHRILSMEEQLAMTEFVMRAVTEISGVQLMVSLYLGANVDIYRQLAERYGAVIAEGIDVKELVPHADLVVCVRTSITWTAIACRKPTITLDLWRMGPVSFYECPGVTLIQRQEDFRPALRQLLTDTQAYAEAVEVLKEAAPFWASHFDGNAVVRIVSLIDAVAAECRPAVAVS